MRRPLCLCVGVYLLFSLLTLTFPEKLTLLMSVLLAFLSIAFLLFRVTVKKRVFSILFLIFLFASVAVFKTTLFDLENLEEARALDGKYLTAEGRVESISKSSDYTVALVTCDEVNGDVSDVKASVIIQGKHDVDVGSIVSFSGEADFEEDSYNKGEGCFITVYSTSLDSKAPTGLIPSFIFHLREKIGDATSSAHSSGLLKSLIIADKSEISADTRDAFRKLGISHILAISGLHLSILVMSAYLLLQRYSAGKYVSVSVSIFLTLFYMALTGFSYSVVRAGGMMILYLLSRLLRRLSDSITSLFFAGFIIILIDSWSVFSLSLQLSFLSTLGILAFLPPVTRAYDRHFHDSEKAPTKKRLFLKAVVEYLLVSLFSTLSATLMTLPVILVNFNEVSLISPLSNLLIVFVAKYFLIFGCIGTVLSLLGIPSAFAFFIPDLIEKVMLWLVFTLLKISPPLVGMDMGFVKLGAAIILVLALLSLLFCRKVLTLPVTSLVVAVFFVVFNIAVSSLTFNHLRVSAVWGRGCNTVFLSSEGKSCLADLTYTDSGRVAGLFNVMSSRKITSVDEMVFAIRDDVPESRIKLILSILDTKKLTLLLPSDFEDDFISVYSLCEDKGIEFKAISSSLYTPLDSVEILNLDGSTVLNLQKEKNGMTFARIGEEGDIPYFENTKITFTDTNDVSYSGDTFFGKDDLPLSFWRITEDEIIRE